MLKFILPTGSLAEAVRNLLKPTYAIPLPDRTGFCGIVNDIEFWQLDRRTIPDFLITGLYDAGLTGRDLWISSGATGGLNHQKRIAGLREICALNFSRSSDQPTRWVLVRRVGEVFATHHTVVIGCELPNFAKQMLKDRQFGYQIVEIFGSEEQCVRDGVIEMALVVTETGKSIEANGLEIVPGFECVFESTPVMIARPLLDADKEKQLAWLSAALRSALGARQKVMVVCDIPSSVDIPALALPSVIAPTVASLTEKDWCSCTICIPVFEQGRVLSILEDAGARGIVVIPVQGYLA